jgi:hypothetical protein
MKVSKISEPAWKFKLERTRRLIQVHTSTLHGFDPGLGHIRPMLLVDVFMLMFKTPNIVNI